MALYRCGGGSEVYQETSLWTNSSPTSSFAAQTVTLSDDVDNYDFIKVVMRASTSDATIISETIPVAQFKQSSESAASGVRGGLSARVSSKTCVRSFYYSDDTTIGFTAGYQLNSTTANSSSCIPTEILGIKGKPQPDIFDFYDSQFSTTAQATYTFNTDLEYCYAISQKSTGNYYPTYTGAGVSTLVYNGTNTAIYKIAPVKSGETFKAAYLSINSNQRSITTFMGKY